MDAHLDFKEGENRSGMVRGTVFAKWIHLRRASVHPLKCSLVSTGSYCIETASCCNEGPCFTHIVFPVLKWVLKSVRVLRALPADGRPARRDQQGHGCPAGSRGGGRVPSVSANHQQSAADQAQGNFKSLLRNFCSLQSRIMLFKKEFDLPRSVC